MRTLRGFDRGVFTLVFLAGAVGAPGCGSSGGGPTGTSGDLAQAGAADLVTEALDGGTFTPSCTAPKGVTSDCGDDTSIVRVVAHLPRGGTAREGDLVLALNHYRLGDGALGGVGHTGTSRAGIKLDPGASLQLDLDMCAGGDMWSEENCEFWLIGFLDLDGSGTLDQGEPAGHALLDVSCHGDGPACVGLVLDCTDGDSCVAFDDPPACTCRKPTCGSSIVTCH